MTNWANATDIDRLLVSSKLSTPILALFGNDVFFFTVIQILAKNVAKKYLVFSWISRRDRVGLSNCLDDLHEYALLCHGQLPTPNLEWLTRFDCIKFYPHFRWPSSRGLGIYSKWSSFEKYVKRCSEQKWRFIRESDVFFVSGLLEIALFVKGSKWAIINKIIWSIAAMKTTMSFYSVLDTIPYGVNFFSREFSFSIPETEKTWNRQVKNKNSEIVFQLRQEVTFYDYQSIVVCCMAMGWAMIATAHCDTKVGTLSSCLEQSRMWFSEWPDPNYLDCWAENHIFDWTWYGVQNVVFSMATGWFREHA